MMHFPTKRSLLRLPLLVCVLGILLAGCGRKEEAQTPAAQNAPPAQSEPIKISSRLKWLAGTTYIGSILAKESGYWKAEGLDVTLLPGGFEADPIKLVAAGSSQFGTTGGDQLLQARANGVPIVAIYAELRDSPVGWMALRKTGIKTPQDFVGRKIGAMAGTNVEPTFDALAAKLALDLKKIKRVPVKFDMSPLFTGQVDAIPVYLNGQPIEVQIDGHDVTTVNPADYGIRLVGNVVFTTEAMIRERPQVVQAYVNGLVKGWSAAIRDPEGSIDTMLKVTPGLERKKEIAILNATQPFITGGSQAPIGTMAASQWQETKDILVKFASLDASVDIARAFDNRFVDAAQRPQGK